MRNFDPDAIILIAVCNRHGTFAGVATELGAHQSTVARKVDRLESALGYPITTRRGDGFSLTAEGKALVGIARDMEGLARDFAIASAALSEEKTRTIRVQCPDGLGSYWIVPHYVNGEISKTVKLDMTCLDTLPEFGRDTIDISIQYSPSPIQTCRNQVIGYLTLKPYATAGYLAQHGQPDDLADLRNHKLIMQIGPHGVQDLWQVIDEARPVIGLLDAVSMSTNSGSAHYAAVSNGLGIGAFPTYAESLDPRLLPIDINIYHTFPVYAVYDRKTESLRQFAPIIEWLQQVFCPETYPFFAPPADSAWPDVAAAG